MLASSPVGLPTADLTVSLMSEHVPMSDSDSEQFVDSSLSGQPLRRFYFRTIVGALGPLVLWSYFVISWKICLVPAKPDAPVAFDLSSAKCIFCSRFIAGIIGLNLSLHGLTGT